MKSQHLSEMELQLFAEGNTQAVARFSSHVKACTHCKTEVNSYRSLFNELEDDNGFLLSADFADKTMKRIRSATGNGKVSYEWSSILLAGCAFVALIVYFGYVNYDPQIWTDARRFLSGSGNVLSGEPFTSLAAAALVLALVAVIEKLLLFFQQPSRG